MQGKIFTSKNMGTVPGHPCRINIFLRKTWVSRPHTHAGRIFYIKKHGCDIGTPMQDEYFPPKNMGQPSTYPCRENILHQKTWVRHRHTHVMRIFFTKNMGAVPGHPCSQTNQHNGSIRFLMMRRISILFIGLPAPSMVIIRFFGG